MELLEDEKLDQMLLKFVISCSFGMCNLITSLKHCPDNLSSIDCILTLKACMVMIIFRIIIFLVNTLGKRLFTQESNGVGFGFYLVRQMQPSYEL
jgi:hypothetical protein